MSNFGYHTHEYANRKKKKSKLMITIWNDFDASDIKGFDNESNNFIILIFFIVYTESSCKNILEISYTNYEVYNLDENEDIQDT